jgi:thiopeptide-type bacteriocin biosynthesis protein
VPASVAATPRLARALTGCDHEQSPAGPGGDWTYVKLYGAESELDALLRDHAGRIVAACADVADLDRWFFLRYRDPQHHLRLRLRAKDGQGAALVTRLCTLLELLLADGSLRRYAFDTYEPELERYGGIAAQTAVQHLFRRDSERVLDVLAAPTQASDRVRIALRSAAPFVSAWFRAVPAKGWLDYHAVEARAEKDATDYALVRELGIWLDEAEAIRDVTDDDAIAELSALDAAGTLTQPVNAVFSAVLHMHLNRVGIPYDDEPAVRAHVWRAIYGRTVRARATVSGKVPIEAA